MTDVNSTEQQTNEQKKQDFLDWGFFTFLFGILIVLLGWLWVAIIAGTTSVQQVEANTAQLEDHEQRLRLIESDLGQLHSELVEVRNDVAWIRHHLENGE